MNITMVLNKAIHINQIDICPHLPHYIAVVLLPRYCHSYFCITSPLSYYLFVVCPSHKIWPQGSIWAPFGYAHRIKKMDNASPQALRGTQTVRLRVWMGYGWRYGWGEALGPKPQTLNHGCGVWIMPARMEMHTKKENG